MGLLAGQGVTSVSSGGDVNTNVKMLLNVVYLETFSPLHLLQSDMWPLTLMICSDDHKRKWGL